MAENLLSSLVLLAFTTLWANSADDKFMTFSLIFPENRIWHLMLIVSIGDSLHEMFLEKSKKKKKINK